MNLAESPNTSKARLAGFGPSFGVTNVFKVSDGLYSGSSPLGEPGLSTLKGMGFASIISVDGSRPLWQKAEEFGLRYVHLPIGYGELSTDDRLKLTRAVQILQGPVYLHCHHGKHRAPVAASIAAISLGLINRDEALDLLSKAGTSPDYPRLYDSVRASQRIEDEVLANVSTEFPAFARVPGFVEGMTKLESSMERLTLLKSNHWDAPPDHPDLAPLSEASQLSDTFRDLGAEAKREGRGEELINHLTESARLAAGLEVALEHDYFIAADKSFDDIKADCTSCHLQFRK